MPRERAVASPAAAAQQSQIKYKGIWEPVNYKEDLQLLDVFFATVDEGWVSGKAGTILHTVDGGKSWTAELGGDPQSADDPIEMFRFLDQRHGWAVQNYKLLKTSDGQNWEEAGTIVQNLTDYRFISPQVGFALGGGGMSSEMIYRTVDGGRNWKQVFECATKLEIEGLTKQVDCRFLQLHFTSSRVGYAVGGHPMCGNCGGPPLIAKTEDGGMSWRILVGPGDPATSTLDAVFFVDDLNGFVRVGQGQKLFLTNDGGQTWRGVVASPGKEIRFADPEVGWSFDSRRLSYTVDGGKHWLSREFRFPADVYGFSFPRRDRGYVVGEHGMVYRYRVVPMDYATANMIEAPVMPAYGAPILGHLQEMKSQVAALQAKLGGARGGGSFGAQLPARETEGFASGGSRGIGPNDSETVSDPPPSTTQEQSTPSAASGGDFVQDTTGVPASQFVQNCCASQVQNMQTEFSSIAQQLPSFHTHYRSLNLILAGLNMAANVVGKAKAMRESFVALKKAPDAPAALAALQELSAKLENAGQSISTGFQNFSAGGTPGGASGGAMSAASGMRDFLALKNVKHPQAAVAAVMNTQGQMTGLMQMMRTAFQKPR